MDGTVDERLLVLSYHTTVRGAKSSGTLILQGNHTGKVFAGRWAGYDQGHIISLPCMWIRVDDKLASPANRELLLKEAKKVLTFYDVQDTEEEALEGMGVMFVKPHFRRPKESFKPTDLFVLMPFEAELKSVYTYQITSVARRLGLTIARADDFFTARSVMLDIWEAICASRAIIADCTGRNPNVFYEIGLAHVVGKPVVLITQNSDDIPFDIKHLRHIQYEFTPQGMKLLEQRLEKTLKTLLGLERDEGN